MGASFSLNQSLPRYEQTLNDNYTNFGIKIVSFFFPLIPSKVTNAPFQGLDSPTAHILRMCAIYFMSWPSLEIELNCVGSIAVTQEFEGTYHLSDKDEANYNT